LDRVPLPVSATLVAVAVSNNTLVVVFDTPQILRIDLLQGDQIECKYIRTTTLSQMIWYEP
jgi:hypothetical protein